MAAALLISPHVQTQSDLRGIYNLLHQTKQAFLITLIVILKQFIIKYEHFVQRQLYFTKTKSYNKNCWSLIYNMNYGLKSCLHKSQIYKKKKKFWASCCSAEVHWCGHSHPSHALL